MRRLLVLCRHGNTFNPGEKVVLVGSQQDLVLTPFGKAQAVAVGQVLVRSSLTPTRIITAPLKRTREFAEIVAELVGATGAVSIDSRLTELDYGAWAGLSDEEISQQWGAEALRRWQVEGVRPEGITFTPSAGVLEAEIRDVLGECAAYDGVTLVVTSNGRLRECARVVSGTPTKVKTGQLCVLECSVTGEWQVVCWDCEPEALTRYVP